MSRLACRVATFCLVVHCARAADRDPWLKITSVNFELFTTGNERSGRDLIRHFEQVRSFFLQAFGSGLPNAKPVRIVAFRNQKEYEPYRPNEFATAFYQPGESHDFIVMSYGAADRNPVAVHEFTHLMVHQGGQTYPPWLNEGVAELFSNLQPVGNRIKVGQDIPGRLMVLRREPWIPLSTLLTVEKTSPYYNEKSKAGMFYAESWELVHMLFLHPAYRPQLKALVAALKLQEPEAAFQAAYGKPLAQIESDLRGYLRGDNINVLLFDVQLPAVVDTPEIEAASGLNARLTLAELLANYRGRAGQARAAYESLARDYPGRWEVERGWGRFSWHQRNIDDAARHYARAVELGAHDAGLYLDYGRVLFYGNRLAEAIDVLGKAARLNPASDEVHFELGAVYVRHGNFGAALAELRAVRQAPPAQAYRYFYNQAFAEYRLGQAAEAKTHAARARALTRDPEELRSLDRLDRALATPGLEALPATPDDAAAEPPRIERRAPAPQTEPLPAPAAALPVVEGALENLECGKLARLHVRADGQVRIYVIPDPRAIALRTAAGEPVELECGPQKPARFVRIEYQPLPAQSDAAGLVRSLEFK